MHLKQPGFTYTACGPFTKTKERMQQFKETGDSRYVYRNELDKASFQQDLTYGDFKDLTRRTGSDKTLGEKAIDFAKNPKYDGYQRRLGSVFYELFDNKMVVVLKMRKCQTSKWQKNCIKQLLKNSRIEKYNHLLQTIFGMLILLICNKSANLIKEFVFYDIYY